MVKTTIINTIKGIAPTPGYVGVEIEVEGENLPKIVNGWRLDIDPSLKAEESVEYVTPHPQSIEEALGSIDILESYFNKKKSKIFNSVRTGVHVHFNVQDWLVLDLFTFSTCYYILEDILTSYCGPTRQGNHFCLRARDAEEILFALNNTAKFNNFKHLNTDHLRYATLNYLSLFKYGSLEFRAMKTTNNFSDIKLWIKILNEIINNSKAFKNPREVVESFSGGPESYFVKRMLGEHYPLFKEFPNLEQNVREGARRIQIFAFSNDWTKYKAEKVNPFK